MSSTSVSTRERPSKRFDDYVLTKEVSLSAGLYPVASKNMQYILSNGSYYYIEEWPYSSAGLSGAWYGNSYIDIGFDFPFCQTIYRRVLIDISGVCFLIDPSVDVTTMDPDGEIMDGAFTSDNAALLDTFSHNHAVLAPWWSSYAVNTWRTMDDTWDLNDPESPGALSLSYYTQQLNLWTGLATAWRSHPTIVGITRGLREYPLGLEESHGGTKFFRGEDREGKFLLIRWKSFTNYGDPLNVVKFDLVLYENGTIEFRYCPKTLLPTPGYWKTTRVAEESTCGVFLGGTSYRDFSSLLGYKTTRPEHPNGGSIYDGVYTAKYFSELNTYDNWPGQSTSGAVLRFNPPTVRRRQNKSVLPLRDSVSFVRTGGSSLFDDQKTISFTTQTIRYPSMMPNSFMTNSNSSDVPSVLELYSSGSISVSRTVTPGLFDSVFNDSSIESSRRSGK